jgi:hypothetical protein
MLISFCLYKISLPSGIQLLKAHSVEQILQCNHACGHGFKCWKQPLVEMQGKAVYIRPKVAGRFLGHCVSGSYMHRAAQSCLEKKIRM